MGNDPYTLNENALGGWGSPSSSEGRLRRSIVDISSAQILALHTTPVQLAAGVAGMIIEPELYRVQFLQGTVSYSGGGSIQVKWGASVVTNDTLLNGIPINGANTYQTTRSVSFSLIPSSTVIGQPLNLAGSAPTQFLTGNGTLRIWTYYRLIPVL